MLNKDTWGVKKCEANQKQHASRQVQPKALTSAEAKNYFIKKLLTPKMTYKHIFHGLLCHLVTFYIKAFGHTCLLACF